MRRPVGWNYNVYNDDEVGVDDHPADVHVLNCYVCAFSEDGSHLLRKHVRVLTRGTVPVVYVDVWILKRGLHYPYTHHY